MFAEFSEAGLTLAAVATGAAASVEAGAIGAVFAAAVLFSVTRLKLASSIPEMESLKFLIALPIVFPSSGKRLGPMIRRITPTIKMCSNEIPNMPHEYRLRVALSI